MTGPPMAPDGQGHHMGEKLKIANRPVCELRRDTGGEELIVRKTKPTETGAAICPPGGARVDGDIGREAREEKRAAVPYREMLLPPSCLLYTSPSPRD